MVIYDVIVDGNIDSKLAIGVLYRSIENNLEILKVVHNEVHSLIGSSSLKLVRDDVKLINQETYKVMTKFSCYKKRQYRINSAGYSDLKSLWQSVEDLMDFVTTVRKKIQAVYYVKRYNLQNYAIVRKAISKDTIITKPSIV